MSRLQLALNVSDLEESIAFYTKFFRTEPAKVRPGYANFAVADPPLKLVLIEVADARGAGTGGALNHLGIEVVTPDEVGDAAKRLADDGVDTEVEEQTTCCYAVQDKVWASDPDGAPWEIYTVLDDAPRLSTAGGGASCCATAHEDAQPDTGAAPAATCC